MSDTCHKCGKDLVDVCPICGGPVETYSRVVGYLRPIRHGTPASRLSSGIERTIHFGDTNT